MDVVRMNQQPPHGGSGQLQEVTPPLVVTPHPGNGTDPAEDAFENLMPALLQCFGVIFAGYFAGRINLLTQNQGRGIGAFVGR